jgi:hypothetical protein
LPTVEISASSLPFGKQVVDSRSQPKTVLLLNRGSSPLTIRKISSSGDFAVASDCGAALDPGHGCTVVTTFSPSLTGDADGKLTIEDDSKSSPHVVSLSGVGVLPVTITPSVLRFEPRTIGTTETASVTLTNNQARDISAVQTSASADFSPSNACAGGIPAGKSCQMQITFRPLEAKPIRGKVTITYGGESQALVVMGSGIASAPTVSGLPVVAVKVPAVTGKAPVIPPTPTLPITLSNASRPAAPGLRAPEVITPPPSVSGNLPASSSRNTVRATPAIIPPPPSTSGRMSSNSARPQMSGAPGVIAPAPSTSTLAMMADNAPPVLGAAPVPPTESAPVVATARPPAETRAVHAIETPASAQSDSAPASIPVPLAKSKPPAQQSSKPASQPAMVAAVVPPVTRRAAPPAVPQVTLTVGLKGTAAGTVTSSTGEIRCGDACRDNFASGEKVVLVPQSLPNSSFAGWRGCDAVAGNHCTVVMDRDKSVTAIFVKHYDDLNPE